MDDRTSRESDTDEYLLTRQQVIKAALMGVTGAAIPGVLAACGTGGHDKGTTRVAPEGTPAAGQDAVGEAKTGGMITIAMSDGGPQETLNPYRPDLYISGQRSQLIYEPLFYRDPASRVVPRLALGAEPGKNGRTWKVTLRDDVTFHDGKPFSADDVLYTFRQALDPKTKAAQAAAIDLIDERRTRKDGDHAVIFHLKEPVGDFAGYLGNASVRLPTVRAGTTDWSTANGTGAYKLKSFDPGQRTELVRYDGYWGHAYIGELALVTIADPVQRVNALVAGTVDAAYDVNFAQADVLRNDKRVQLLSSTSNASWVGVALQIDVPPFNNPDVLTALKLSVDRDQTIRNALRGFGTMGDDIPGKGFPSYNDTLTQRHYDPEQAKALLKRAGHENLTFTLATSDVSAGMLESATAWKQQARKAGVTINLDKSPGDSYWTDKWLKVPACQVTWNGPFEAVASLVLNSHAKWNETHWRRREWDADFTTARAETDSAKRNEALKQLQEPLWEDGGYILWGFRADINAIASRIHGAVPTGGYFDPRPWWVA